MNDIRDIMAARKPEEQRDCETHGAYMSKNILGKIWTQCPACTKEAQEKKDAAEAEEKAAAKVAAKKAEWAEKLGRAAIPERFHDRTLKNYSASNKGQESALAFALEYADNFDQVLKTGRSAVFVGRPGTGKTHLAVGIALRAMGKFGADALFITVRQAMMQVKDTFKKDSERTELDVVRDFVKPDLLVLDEVGVQSGTDFEKFTLFDIVNARYERRKPTIFLSNLPDDGVAAYLGERIMDRLREDGGAVIPFDWESQRGKV